MTESRELSSFVKQEDPVSAPAEDKIAVEQEKTETAYNLELIGTAIGNTKDPSAFIKDLDSGKQSIYKMGSRIREAKVVKIALGRVVLDINGQEQILTLSARGKAWAHLEDTGKALISFSGDQILVNRSGLASESGKILKDFKRVKVSPYYDSNSVAGLKVEGVAPDSIMAAAGIHDKDVVTMVNSQKIDSYQKALQVLNKARGQNEIKVSVLRDGQPQLLSYKLQ